MQADPRPAGCLSLDEAGRIVGFDDESAAYLRDGANRAMLRPYDEALEPGLAAAVRSALEDGTADWEGGRVVSAREGARSVLRLLAPAPADPARVVSAVTTATGVREVCAILAAFGHLLAPRGSLSVRSGNSDTWVPAATWGGAPAQPFEAGRCLALRSGLPHAAAVGDPLPCAPLSPPSVCVPIHRAEPAMLLTVAGTDAGPAVQVALALQSRATHPDWRG